jgi:branched-chain amino acid transport system substrate-binding protein
MQAMAIAELAEQTGARTAAVAYLDDTYGRPLAQATMEALEGRQLTVALEEPFNAGDEDLAVHANALIGADAGVILLIGDADEGTRMLAALGEATVGVEPTALPDVVVNGAMRQPPAPLVQALPPALRDVVRGVAPVAMPTTPDEPQGPYATNAADCVNLIALAAAQAESDDPADMSAQIDEVSSTGVTCADFASCVALLEDNNIDYDGPSGAVEIGADGNPERGRFEVFGFDANGIDQFQRPLSIST